MGEDRKDQSYAQEVTRDYEIVAHYDYHDCGVHVISHVAAVSHVVVQQRAQYGEEAVLDVGLETTALFATLFCNSQNIN